MATLADSSGIAYVSTHAVFISPQVRSYAYGKHGVTVEVIESAQCQSFSAIISTYSGRQLEAGISFIIGQRMETAHGHGQGTDSIYFLGYIMNLVVQTGNISLTGSGFLLELVLEGIISGFTGSSLIADGLLVSCNGSIVFCIFVGTDFSFCLICCIAGSCFCIDITLQLLVCYIAGISFCLICYIAGISFCIDITLQLLVCCIAGFSFSKIIFIELIGNRSNVFVKSY